MSVGHEEGSNPRKDLAPLSTEVKTVLMRRERVIDPRRKRPKIVWRFKLANAHRQALGDNKGIAHPARGGSQARQDPVMISESDGRGEKGVGEMRGRQGLGVKCREVEKATVGSEGIELADGRALHLNAQIPGWFMDGGGVWFPCVRDLVPLSCNRTAEMGEPVDVSPDKRALYLGFGYGTPVFVREAEIAMAYGTNWFMGTYTYSGDPLVSIQRTVSRKIRDFQQDPALHLIPPHATLPLAPLLCIYFLTTLLRLRIADDKVQIRHGIHNKIMGIPVRSIRTISNIHGWGYHDPSFPPGVAWVENCTGTDTVTQFR
ncbi:uncharacterized protein CLUP02_08262 [Colletotrichum lupini]|uniref:Uncharacterized protein n=1 Tax=Colletotrichum lupini TaxID=145971 RepID=A0A9Q8SUF8_9PEZI|nr:uncharacterized protein CLUP02_08262 [Colletotrichum lupini]UQC82772.1 hypothetical protein CLUP02_08262 [Colletotrichum lupini]